MKPGPKGPRSHVTGFRRRIAADVERLEGLRFPIVKYQEDPVAFVREVLGETPMPHQAEIMMALAGNMRARVAVRSGQKTGKTKLVIWLALWFASCVPGARVFMTASTREQVERVLWVELCRTVETGRKRGNRFDIPPRNPGTGYYIGTGEIRGFTTRTREAMAGLSGAQMLFIGDEASSFEPEIAEAIEGNTAGAARMIWISNPTRAEGPFYDCFFSQKRFWTTFHLSSAELAAKNAGEGIRVPGTATLEDIELWRDKYGEDSPFYLVRAKGDFVLDEQAKCISLHNIMAAQGRWKDAAEDGPLSLGCDPAGDRGEGDEFAFAVVRGAKLVALYAFRGLSEEAAVAQALGLIKEHRKGDEAVRVVVDAEGPIGSAFYGRMRAVGLHKEIHAPGEAFTTYGIKGSNPARRAPDLYERIRDELWAGLAEWIKTGAILPDHKLEEELYAPGFLISVQGKRKATAKDVLREKLGRSPDRADALGLAVWSPSPWVRDDFAGLPNAEVNAGPGAQTEDKDEGLDPYGSKGGFSPWEN